MIARWSEKVSNRSRIRHIGRRALTIFATVTILVEQGRLSRLDADLAPGVMPTRMLYAVPVARAWLENELPLLAREWDADAEPIEQVDALLQRYAAGKALGYGRDVRCLRPCGDGIWEFKTGDVRIFGWFPMMDVFVATNAKDATTVKRLHLYGPMVIEAIGIRDALGLPFVPGDDVNVVLSSED